MVYALHALFTVAAANCRLFFIHVHLVLLLLRLRRYLLTWLKKNKMKQAQTTLFFMYCIHVRLMFETAAVYQTDHRFGLGFPEFLPGCYP